MGEVLVKEPPELNDISNAFGVEMRVREDGRVVWFNVDGICLARVSNVVGPVYVEGPHISVTEDDMPNPTNWGGRRKLTDKEIKNLRARWNKVSYGG